MARVYASRTRGLRVATRCASVDQFVATFYRQCDASSIFVSTLASRPVGLETPFEVDLVGGAPVLRGVGVVLAAWATTRNPFGRPGVKLGVRRLTADSERVFEELLIARALAEDAASAVPVAIRSDMARRPGRPTRDPVATLRMPSRFALTRQEPPPRRAAELAETRTPGSPVVLPANPLTDLSDSSLAGFVECSLYETGRCGTEASGARRRPWWWPVSALRKGLRRLARG